MALRCCALALALLALALLASALQAQVPGVTPPVPPIGGAGGAGAAGAAGGVAGPAGFAAPAAAPPRNLWSFLCPTPEQCAQCKQRLCNVPLIQFFGSALTPARALSGGLMPRVCPGPLDANPADLNKPPDSAEGAAARIKEKEAQAKARRAAVRYLGTVDCRRYPEAEAALVNALRGDENECVRWEAALALGRGCCCTKKVMLALVDSVSGKKTTEPAETSERVKLTAAAALEHCLMRYCEESGGDETPPESPPEEKPPETPPEPGIPPKPGERVARLRPDPLIAEARRALAQHRPVGRPVEARPTEPPPPVDAPPIVNQLEAALALAGTGKPASPGTDNQPGAVIYLTPRVSPAQAAAPPKSMDPPPLERPSRKSRDLFSVLRDSLR